MFLWYCSINHPRELLHCEWNWLRSYWHCHHWHLSDDSMQMTIFLWKTTHMLLLRALDMWWCINYQMLYLSDNKLFCFLLQRLINPFIHSCINYDHQRQFLCMYICICICICICIWKCKCKLFLRDFSENQPKLHFGNFVLLNWYSLQKETDNVSLLMHNAQ